MRRLLLPFAAAFVLVLGLGTFAVAQDASPTADVGEKEENVCAEVMGSPVASPETTMVEVSSMASPPAEEGCEVDIEDFAFRPATIQIAVGDTVTWENYDSIAHTVTGDNGEFDSGRLDQDQTFSFTVNTAGTFTCHCEFHPAMTGSIFVQ